MAANFCVMRMEKIKSAGSLRRALEHNSRDRQPLNADPEKAKENSPCMGTEAAMLRYRNLKPDKVRKNAVHAVEVVMTASAEFKGDWNKYLDACDTWATNLFGIENVLHVAHHRDEQTPHTHIVFLPLKDGKLNAKHFIGGSKDRMTELQDDFYEKVGKRFELERGRPKQVTKARHRPHTLEFKAKDLEAKEKALGARERALGAREKELAAKEKKLRQTKILFLKSWKFKK